MALPDFLVAGVPKAGTTALHAALALAEIEDAALAFFFVACRGRDVVSSSPHRPGSFRFPSRRRSPFDASRALAAQ